MKKKIISLCLVIALAVTAVTGATLAYFTDWDGDVNVMSVGNVHIDQTEVFTEGEYLFPGQQNTVTKKVSVENVGTEDAYIRTLYAFEDSWDANGGLVHYEFCDVLGQFPKPTWKITWPSATNPEDYLQIVATVDGVKTIYTVGYYEYAQEVITPEMGKIQTLDSVWLDPKADNNWSALVGDKYDVLVLSQAVQVAGFENDYHGAFKAAFGLGEITAASDAKVAEWFQQVLADKYEGKTVTVEVFNYSEYTTEGSEWNWANKPTATNNNDDHDDHVVTP